MRHAWVRRTSVHLSLAHKHGACPRFQEWPGQPEHQGETNIAAAGQARHRWRQAAAGRADLFSAVGAPVGPALALAATGEQQQLTLSPLEDGTVVAAWVQVTAGAAGPSWGVSTRRFDGALQPITAAAPIVAPASASGLLLSAAPLASGNVALAWTTTDPNAAAELRSVVVTPNGVNASPVAYTLWGPAVSQVMVVPLGAAGFGVAWEVVRGHSRGTDAAIWMQRHAVDGSALAPATTIMGRSTARVSVTSGRSVRAPEGSALRGGTDGHFVGAFHSAGALQAETLVFGR